MTRLALLLALAFASTAASATPGAVRKDGCHGDGHCHATSELRHFNSKPGRYVAGHFGHGRSAKHRKTTRK